MVGVVFSCACMACARGFCFPRARAFFCLKQDGQDCQDGQDFQDSRASGSCQMNSRDAKGSALQVRKDLHVYSTSEQQGVKVLKDLNLFASCVRFVIKVLSDLENPLHTFSIDIKVLTDLKRHRAEKTVLAMVGAFFCLKQDGQDCQDLQDERVWQLSDEFARCEGLCSSGP